MLIVRYASNEGHHNGALGKSKLLSSLMDMTGSFLELTPSCRLLLLDVLGQYFRNSEPFLHFLLFNFLVAVGC
jgi:hypothetical protein